MLETPDRITVFAADDHPVYREGLARAIEGRPPLHLVGQSSSGREALTQIKRLRPDVALLDVRMPDLGGLEILASLLLDGLPTRIVFVSAFGDSALVYEALAGGASAYIPKHAERHQICDAIVSVARGEAVISPELQTAFVEEVRARERGRRPALSRREQEVLELTADGLSRVQIGERLFLSPHTVKTHLQNTYDKLGVCDRAALIAEAMRRGLIS